MSPLRLKSCPRCIRGDLTLERGLGSYREWVCIQCGHTMAEGEVPAVPIVPRAPYKPRVHRAVDKEAA